jgi:hypothetical protein
MMRNLSKQSSRWLNVLFAIMLLTNLFLPVSSSLASTSTTGSNVVLSVQQVTNTKRVFRNLGLESSGSLAYYQVNQSQYPQRDDNSTSLAIPENQIPNYYYVKSYLGSSGPGSVEFPENSVDGQNETYTAIYANCDLCYEDVDYSLGGIANGVVSIQVYSYAFANPYTHWPTLTFYTSVDGTNWVNQGTIQQNDAPQWRTRSFASSDGITHIRIRSSTGSNILSLPRQSYINAVRIQAESFTPDFSDIHLFPLSSLSSNECPPTGCNTNANHFTNYPINTRTGNYNYQTTDLSLTAVGQPLKFECTYNSLPVGGDDPPGGECALYLCDHRGQSDGVYVC